MKKIFLVLTLLSLCGTARIFSLEVPSLTGPVVDSANIMSPAKENELTDYLMKIDYASDVQIAVLTVKSLEGESLEEYAIKVAREWGLGKSDTSRGVLLLVAYEEKKLRIETGYGVEGDLTDAKCGLIIRNVIAPEFKVGKYSEGIIDGVRAIAGVVAPESGQAAPDLEENNDGDFASSVAMLIFFSLYFIMFTGMLSTKFGALKWLPWAPFFISHHHSGRTSGHYNSFSGGSSGFGGGFSSGGGFSGGGGGFGGGGASGGW